MPKKETKNDENPIFAYQRSISQKAADRLSSFLGSWTFILLFVVFIVLWISANVYAWLNNWDPYPFILLNLALSIAAALQAPIILMAQNRTSQKDRIRAEYDYQVNRKAEKEIIQIKTQLDRIEKNLQPQRR